ncbi:hypothetical protein CRM22_006698 [Opisthorchis felineus]|uniref:Tyrosine specific protein phosphatases domain-containing protein n=1 Tax=Opisthorchis felineus TaxID=147828 RepID=A0A4S2LJK7_OPIFE|nr:hypothetical protein CRM22_006698 [Opisthorchis felineus]
MNLLTFFLFLLTFLSGFVDNANYLERCNTMPNDALGIFSNHANTDYERMKITYLKQSEPSDQRQRIYYVVRKPAAIHSVLSMDVMTSEIFLNCTTEPSGLDNSCCIHNTDYRESYEPQNCEFDTVVYNMGYQENEPEYIVVYEHLNIVWNFTNQLILFTLRDGVAPTYFSAHEGRDVNVICPQIATAGSHITSHPKLDYLLTSRVELHTIRYEDLHPAVRVEEYTNLTLEISGYARNSHIFQIWYIYDNRYGDHQTEGESSGKTNGKLRISKLQPELDSSYDTNLKEHLFSLRIQWDPNYKYAIRRWRQTITIGRDARALLLIIHDNVAQVDELFLPVLQAWLSGSTSPKFEWPTTIQSPALRLFRLSVTRKALFNEGDSKIMHVNPDEMIHESTGRKVCDKRLQLTDDYTPSRMFMQPNKSYYEIHNLRIEDTGMYTCYAGDGRVIVSDQYVIVLPRLEDLVVIITDAVPATQTKLSEIEDNYPYVDSDGMAMFHGEESIHACCGMILHRGLDNLGGLNAIYEVENMNAMWNETRRSTEKHGDYFHLIMCYVLYPLYTMTELRSSFTCQYRYRPNDDLVRQNEEFTDRYAVEHVKSRQITASKYPEPRIFPETIYTSSLDLTRQLTSHSYLLPTLYGTKSVHVGSIQIFEGLLISSFVALLDKNNGWGSVWMLQKSDSTTTLVQTPCKCVSYEFVTDEESVPKSIPLNSSYNLVRRQFDVECVLSRNVVALLYAAYILHNSELNKAVVEKQIRDWIADHVLHVDSESSSDRKVDVRPPDFLTGIFRMSRVRVGWIGTVNAGSPVKMIWSYPNWTSTEMQCKYAMTADDAKTDLPGGFYFRPSIQYTYFELLKKEASEQDSGLYYCCVKCDSEIGDVIKRLVVLPDTAKFKMRIDRTDSANETGSGSLEDPIHTRIQTLFAHCEYMVYRGLEATVELDLAYETCTPGNEQEYMDLASKRLLKQKLSESVGKFNRLLVVYHLDGPEPDEYWKYVRVSCILQLINLTRDPFDLVDTSSSKNEKLVRSIYFTYNLTRNPAILPDLIFSDSRNLQIALRRNAATRMEDVFNDTLCPIVRERENFYTVNYTLFLGLPRGMIRLWIVHYRTVGKENVVVLSPCSTHQVEPVVSAQQVVGLETQTTYKVNRGINFEQHMYKCLLDISTFAMVIVGFGWTGTNLSLEERESHFRKQIVQLFTLRRHVSVMNSQSIVEHSNVIFRLNRFDIGWTALVHPRRAVQMIGERFEKRPIQCFYKTDDEEYFRPVGPRILYVPVSESVKFLVEIQHAVFSDAGVYKCNVTQVCPDCPVRIGLASRRLHVLPDESLLTVHFNHDRLQMNEQSVHKFEQYTSTNEPYIFPEQSVSFRCLHQLSPVHRLRPRVHLIPEVLNRKNKVMRTLKLHNPLQFITKFNEVLIQTVTGVIVAPTPGDSLELLSVTCRLTYDFGVIPNDLSGRTGVLQLSNKTTFIIKISAPPNIFSVQLLYTNSNLFHNMVFATKHGVSATQFHESGSTGLFGESPVLIHSVQGLGVPLGSIHIWIVYMTDVGLDYDECKLVRRVMADDKHFPPEMKTSKEFGECGGRNIFETFTQCVLQPRHLMLVFLLYNSIDEEANMTGWDTKLSQSLLANARAWFSKPMSSELLQLASPNRARVAYALVKLNIGWQATVTVGEPWAILVGNYSSPDTRLLIYHRRSWKHELKLWRTLSGRPEAFSFGENASYVHTGIYSCVVTNCDDCRLRTCFYPRRLLVFPAPPLLQLYLNERILDPTEPMVDEFTKAALSTDEAIYVHCVYTRPFGLSSNEKLLFSYHLQSHTPDFDEALPYTRLSTSSIENQENGTIVVTPFLIRGPLVGKPQPTVRLECELTFAKDDFELADISRPYRTKPIVCSRRLGTRLRLKPILFTRSIQTSRSLTNWLRQTLIEVSHGKILRDFGSSYKIKEGILKMGLLVSLGLPTGQIYAATFINNNGIVYEEPCKLSAQSVAQPDRVSSYLEQDEEYDRFHDESLFFVEFACVVHKENFALGFLLLSPDEGVDPMTTSAAAHSTLSEWLGQVLNHSRAVKLVAPASPKATLVSYKITWLNVFWNATVRIGSRIKMIGHTGSSQHHVFCSRQADTDAVDLALGDQWQKIYDQTYPYFTLINQNARPTDSGLYTCARFVSLSYRQTIFKRPLLILPDQSVLNVFLTYEQLKKHDQWQENFTDYDGANRPFMYTGTSIFAHCLHETWAEQWLNVSGQFFLYTVNEQGDFLDPLPVNKTKILVRSDSRVLRSSQIHLSLNRDYGHWLSAECEWRFVFTERMRRELGHYISTQQPMLFRKSVRISVRFRLPPAIFHQYSKTADRLLATAISELHSPIQSAVQFHSERYIVRGPERVGSVSWLLSLGVPRAWVNAWTVYQFANHLYTENCLLYDVMNLTRADLPYELKSAHYGRDNECNYVSLQVSCVFHREQIAYIIMVQNYQEDLENKIQFREQVQRSILSYLDLWLQQPNSMEQYVIPEQPGVYTVYRILRLSIDWPTAYKAGHPVNMLGYLHGLENPVIKCYHASTNVFAQLVESQRFEITIVYARLAFLLSKLVAQFYDTGHYTCNVTESFDCSDCPPLVGFPPRPMVVQAHRNLIRLFLNQKLEYPPTRYFTQCTPSHLPYLKTRQETFVFCAYFRQRDPLTWPKHSFRLLMINSQTNTSKLLPTTHIRQVVLKADPYKKVIQVYRIEAPPTEDISGPLHVSCGLTYAYINQSYFTSRRIDLIIFTPPIVFTSLVSTSSARITESIQRHLNSSPTSAMEFGNSGPTGYVLEGKLYVNYTVGLGRPRARSSIDLFFVHRGRLQRRQCLQDVLDDYSRTPIPHSIQISDYSREAGGTSDPLQYNATCHLTTNVVAMVISVMNTHNPMVSVEAQTVLFYHSVYNLLQHWLREPHSSVSNYSLQTHSGAALHYGLFRLNVGWRSSVRVGDPVILFGIQPVTDELENLECYHRYTQTSKPLRLYVGSDEAFVPFVEPPYSSVELIKQAAELSDSGTYECVSRICENCAVFPVIIQHELRVIPALKLDIHVHFSEDFTPEHTEDHHLWTYTQYASPYLPFIYGTQTIAVVCDYHAPPWTRDLFSWDLEAKQTRKIDYYLGAQLLNYTELNRMVKTEKDYVAMFKVFALTGPISLEAGDKIVVHCRLGIGRTSRLQDDVNDDVFNRFYIHSRLLSLRMWITPIIIGQSILTDSTFVTSELKSSHQPNAHQFLGQQFTERLSEGTFALRFSIVQGQPSGISGAFGVYNGSSGLTSYPCVQDLDYYKEANKLDMMGKLSPEDDERHRFVCLLLWEHIAIGIYTVHYRRSQRDVSYLDAVFRSHVVASVKQWLFGHNMNEPIGFPEGMKGDYNLIRVQVRWPNVVKIGQSVVMYGLLDVSSTQKPICYYGHKSAINEIPTSKGFLLEINMELNYFHLYKNSAEMTDSGYYRCSLPNAGGSGQFGFAPRRLVVLPDSSILHLTVESSQSNPDLSSMACKSRNVTRLSPGSELRVSCSHVISKSDVIDTHHIITYGAVGESGTKLSNLVTTVEDGDSTDTMLVRSSGTLRLPVVVKPPFTWFFRCNLPFEIAHVSHESVDDLSWTVSKLHVERQFGIFDTKDPNILGHRMQHSDGTVVNNIVYTRPNETVLRWHDDQLTYQRLPEDSFKVVFTAYPGVPHGWTFVRSFYVLGSTVLSDRCFSTWTLNRTNVREIVHQCICPLQSEHVALLLAVASVDQAVLSKCKVEEHLEDAVLNKISRLLGHPVDLPPNSSVSTFCFRYDYHLIQLHIGWNATVDTGQPIVMYGLLAGRKWANITCFYRRNESEMPKRLDDRFELSVEVHLGRFRITKLDARPHDTGIYFCNRTDELNKSLVGYSGLPPRRLYVLPTSAMVGCLLTLDLNAEKYVSKTQQLEDGTLYLMSNTTAFVHCTFEKEFRQLYDATYQLLYQMGSSATENIKSLKDVVFVRETQNDILVTHTYRILSPSAKYYTGNLRVTCLNVFRNLRTPFDLNNRSDTFRIDCSKSFTIREPAHGTLEFRAIGASLRDKTVPLGTEIVCTGGEGIPAPNHSWYRVQPIRYGPRELPEDIPSILPGDGGGWGGPERPFSDMPTTGLEVRGNRLKVPEDPLYRGMAYAYECVASNIVLGVKYNITKYLYISVLICPSDAGTMDLSILLSRRLMAACRIVDNPNPDVQYYGYFWLTLVRQLVLSLPLGHGRTRVSFIELVQGIRRDARQYNFSTFKKVEDRYTIAYRLYSQKNKPVSGQSVCSSPPTDFGAIFRTAVKLYDLGFKTKPLFLLPVDYFTAIEDETELKSLAEELRRADVKVLLAFTHALDSRLKEFNEKMTQLLKPWRVLSIAPDFEGITDCINCHLPLNTPYLRIRRGELFDAICEASGSRLPDSIPAPSLAYSIPTRYWYHGNTLRVTCIEPLLDSSHPSHILHIVICLANESAMIQLGTILRPNVQQIRTVCNKFLKSQTHFPCLVGSCTQPGHPSVSLILDEHPIDPFVLCYIRLGYKDAKLFDAVNFTQAKIQVHSREIGTPDLRVTHWDRLNTRFVQFSCSFQGFVAGLETLLLFQPEHEPLSGSKPPYMIVSRRRARMNLNSSVTIVPDLFWKEIPGYNSSGQLICLVRPIEINRTPEASFLQLPNTTMWTKYSQPIPSVSANLACPSASRMVIEPTENVTLQAGSSIRVKCQGRSSPDVDSFKLFYLSPIFSIVVCYRPQTILPITVGRSCFLTSSSDDSCSVVLANQSVDHEFYHFECISEADQTDQLENHWIHFKVTKLRSIDLSSVVFCQTVYAFGSETYEGRIIQSRLTSNVHRIRFSQKPDIVYFDFDVHKQLWSCRIMAYPMVSGAQIHQVAVSSRWLRKQLEAYTSHTDHKQPPVKDVQLLRKFDKLALDDQLEYTVSVTFSPIIPVSGGLAHGRVELRCKLGDIGKSLITEIRKHEVRDEPALLPSHVRTQSGMHAECTLTKQHADDRVIDVILHRVQQSSWLSYDLALLTISVEGTTAQRLSEYHKKRSDFGLLGPWVQLSRSALRVLSDQTKLKCSVFVSLPTANVFDSATYYCTGRTKRGNFLISDDLAFISLGDNKKITFGYRSQRESHVWRTTERSVMLNDRILLRCVVWTTSPDDRSLKNVVLSLGDRHNRSHYYSRCVNETLSFGTVICVEDHEELVGSETNLGTFDCEMTDNAGQRKVTIAGPTVVCTAPPRVAAKMSVQNGTTVYECHSEHTCMNPRYSWQWVAGPIPQINLYEDIPHRVNYSEEGLLYESRIARPGFYWFLCRVTCVCGSEPLTHSEGYRIEVPLREDGKRNYRISKPSDGELAPDQFLDANSTTVDRFTHKDQLEAMDLINRTMVKERQKFHTQAEPDYLTEHIETDSQDVADQFEQIFHRRSYLENDIQVEESTGRRPAADATKTTTDRYEDYAFRRTSDSGTKLVVPEVLFRLYEPPAAQRKTRSEVDHEPDTTSTHSPVERMSSSARETLKYSYRMDYTKDKILSLWSPGLQDVVDLPSSMLTQPQLGRSRINQSSRPTTTVDPTVLDQGARHSYQLGNFTAHTHQGKIGRELSVGSWHDGEVPHRKHPHVHLSRNVTHEERLKTRISITPELLDTVHVGDPVTDKTVAIQVRSNLKSKRIGYRVTPNLGNDGIWNNPAERTTHTPTFDAGLRHDWLTKTSASGLSKLRDDSWLERYGSNDMQTDLPWMFDPQTRQYVLNATRNISAVDSASRRPCKPTDRLDLEMFDRDMNKLRRSWTEMPPCGGVDLERVGVTSLVGTVPHSSIAETTEGNLRPAFAWSRHPVNTNSSMHESSFQPAEDHDLDFGSAIEAFMGSVFLKPGFVILPGLVSLVCPGWQPTFRSPEVARSITWFRWSGIEAAKYELVGEVYLQERRVTYARGYAYGTRVHFSPPLKWSNAYTMDLTNAQPYDYGFYGCQITFTNPDKGKHYVTRTTKYPLCVASNPPKPQLWLAKLPKQVAEQRKTSSTTKPHGEHDFCHEHESNTSTCFKPGEEVLILCQSEPYQLFCTGHDESSNGSRLLHTLLRVYHYIPLHNTEEHKVALPDPDRWLPPLQNLHENGIFTPIRAWLLKTDTTKIGTTYLGCEAQPQLDRAVLSTLAYGKWLREEFTVRRVQKLTRRSDRIQLCVIANTSEDGIEVNPRLSSTGDGTLPTVTLGVYQTLTCTWLGNNSMTPLNMSLYKISVDQLSGIERNEREQVIRQIYDTRVPVTWPQKYELGRTHMLVPREAIAGDTYLVVCEAPEFRATQVFILRVQSPRKIVALRKIGVALACFACTLPAFGFLYLVTQQGIRRRRERQLAARRIIIFQEDSHEIFLEADSNHS